jgi:hypothetical protein
MSLSGSTRRRNRTRLFGSLRSFFRKHDGDVVLDGIDPMASTAFETGKVRRIANRRLANGTNQDVQQLLRNGHDALREAAASL